MAHHCYGRCERVWVYMNLTIGLVSVCAVRGRRDRPSVLWFSRPSYVWVPLDVGYVRIETKVELTVSDSTPPMAPVPTTSSLYDILGDVLEYVCPADGHFIASSPSSLQRRCRRDTVDDAPSIRTPAVHRPGWDTPVLWRTVVEGQVSFVVRESTNFQCFVFIVA